MPIPCDNCGYDLASQRLDAKCPECGTPVIAIAERAVAGPRAFHSSLCRFLLAGAIALGLPAGLTFAGFWFDLPYSATSAGIGTAIAGFLFMIVAGSASDAKFRQAVDTSNRDWHHSASLIKTTSLVLFFMLSLRAVMLLIG